MYDFRFKVVHLGTAVGSFRDVSVHVRRTYQKKHEMVLERR